MKKVNNTCWSIHTSAQNVLHLKHACKLLLDIQNRKYVFFPGFVLNGSANFCKEAMEKWIPSVCLPCTHCVHTHVNLCECAVHPSMLMDVFVFCFSLFCRCMCVCACVCLFCLCEFCKLFTALAVSIHCWWQWKVCLIVAVPQWKFNSAPFHRKTLPWSHHIAHVPLGCSFGGIRQQ